MKTKTTYEEKIESCATELYKIYSESKLVKQKPKTELVFMMTKKYYFFFIRYANLSFGELPKQYSGIDIVVNGSINKIISKLPTNDN
mgnify:CR=1 FL=1